jgi:hypothetical protein
MIASLYRDINYVDVKKPGQYVLFFYLKREDVALNAAFPSEQRNLWYDHWYDAVPRLLASRKKREEEIQAEGYQIDSNYQTPRIDLTRYR